MFVLRSFNYNLSRDIIDVHLDSVVSYVLSWWCNCLSLWCFFFCMISVIWRITISCNLLLLSNDLSILYFLHSFLIVVDSWLQFFYQSIPLTISFSPCVYVHAWRLSPWLQSGRSFFGMFRKKGLLYGVTARLSFLDIPFHHCRYFSYIVRQL